ncbi:MAG TPA: lmo0937 family membrane protein [Polyangia bacterium]|jgi:hypothetical protein
MLLLLAVLLGIAWILGFGVYHVTTAAIHILLVLAVVALVLHFVRGVSRRSTV